jgi:hypothetical protein
MKRSATNINRIKIPQSPEMSFDYDRVKEQLYQNCDMTVEITIMQDMMPRRLADIYGRFGTKYSLRFPNRAFYLLISVAFFPTLV